MATPIPMTTGVFPMFSILMFHLGSRQLSFQFTETQQRLFKHPLVQALILLCMFYVSTKNITLSLILTIIYHMCIYILLNETHQYNIIPKSWIVDSNSSNLTNPTVAK